MADLSDAQQVRERRKEARRKLKDQDKDFASVMGTEAGRRVMWRLLEITGLYKSSYALDASIHFNEGQRNIGLQLLADMNRVCPEKYLEMIQENQPAAEEPAADE